MFILWNANFGGGSYTGCYIKNCTVLVWDLFGHQYKRENQNPRDLLYGFIVLYLIYNLLIFGLESGLTCFECSSTASHEECQEHQQEVTCKGSMDDRCYLASMQQTSQDGSSVTKRFKHGCINNKDCSNTANIFDECTSSTRQCEVRCCSENLCNEGSIIHFIDTNVLLKKTNKS